MQHFCGPADPDYSAYYPDVFERVGLDTIRVTPGLVTLDNAAHKQDWVCRMTGNKALWGLVIDDEGTLLGAFDNTEVIDWVMRGVGQAYNDEDGLIDAGYITEGIDDARRPEVEALLREISAEVMAARA